MAGPNLGIEQDMLVSVVAAIVAGACFASANLLQQRVASTKPEGQSLSPRLLLDLAKQRLWVAGIGLALLSYVFQSIALAFGPLSLVQPLIVTELIFAIPLSARIHHLSLGRREWLGCLAVAGGLAVAIIAAHPSQGDPIAPLKGWLGLAVAVAVIVGIALLLGRRAQGPLRASAFAAAAATIMGSQSALLATTIVHLRQGLLPTVTAWQTYLLVVASIGGLLLIQSSYQAGPLAASMPVIDAGEPTVAVLIGVLLFGEALTTVPWREGAAIVGLLCLLGGIVLLDTSPLIRRLHEKEEEEAADQGSGQVGLTAP